MSFTLTDIELSQLIQNASLEAAKQAAEQAAKNVVSALMAQQGQTAPTTTPVIQQATEEEARNTMEAMAANLQNQDAPKRRV